MPSIKKLLTAAAGSAGGTEGYVEDVFSTFLPATGLGSPSQSTTPTAINNGIDLSGEGGLVWIKRRDGTAYHRLFDTERGALKFVQSNSNTLEATLASDAAVNVTGFNNNGFNFIGQSTSDIKFASWCWRKQKGFFDVVKFSTTGGGGTQAISHNLGSIPGYIAFKKTSAAQTWITYHKGVTSPNSNWWRNFAGWEASAQFYDFGDDTGINSAPTATTVTLGTYFTGGTADYIAYFFAEGGSDDQIFGDGGDEAIIKCGTYTGNSSTPGPQVNCGFEPQWVLIKRTSGTAEWQLLDNMRGVVTGGNDRILHPDTNGAEYAQNVIQFNATGFEPVGGSSNTNVGDYMYVAIRRGPMKEPSAGTDVFNGVLTNSDSSGFTGFPVSMGFPVDLPLVVYTTLAASRLLVDRSRGATATVQPSTGMMKPNNTNAQANTGELWGADSMTGYKIYGHNYQRICYGWRRYPKVFDIAPYTGAGAGTHPHNLTVVPELMIIKCTSDSNRWIVYSAALGNTQQMHLDENIAPTTGQFNNTTPTASVFSVSDNTQSGTSGRTYVNYLFATLAGVSKVGSVVHSGTTDVDCGFSGGARFVMVKRSDSTGDWYFWDTVRGIVAGNDPYSEMNTTNVEVTNTDYIDPLASGFTLTSNFTAGTYIFLAFA